MKRNNILALLLFLLLVTGIASATEQKPDYIFYNGHKGFLETSWAWKTPLELYFARTQKTYPFQMLSTANYRGHVATYQIINNELHITDIIIPDENWETGEKTVKKLMLSAYFSRNEIVNSTVKAYWFSGLIKTYFKFKKVLPPKPNDAEFIGDDTNIFFEIERGHVVASLQISAEEYEKLATEIYAGKLSGIDKKYNLILKWHDFLDRTYERIFNKTNTETNTKRCDDK